jgi:diguanylate cyclase (GGDEF)-like protein
LRFATLADHQPLFSTQSELAEVNVVNVALPLDSNAKFEVDRWNLEFRNRTIEGNFKHHHLAETRKSLTTTLTVCSVFYIAFAITDIAALGYSRATLMLLLARLCVALAAALGLRAVDMSGDSPGMNSLVACVFEIVGFAVFMLIVLERANQLPMHAMSLCIMLIVVYIFIPNTLILASGIAMISTATFMITVTTLGTVKAADLLTMAMLLLFTNCVGYVAARRFSQLAREEFRQHSLLKDLSIRDHLTGCFNRRYLTDILFDAELGRGRRRKEFLGIILCDIDHFKLINDTYGHASGDAVLRMFSNILLSHVRESVDSVVRYGGEEFMILLPQTDAHGAAALAERLRQSVASSPTFDLHGREVRSTASFGVVAVDLSGEGIAITEESIILAADAQLYRAKNEGRNQVRVSDDPPSETPLAQAGSLVKE